MKIYYYNSGGVAEPDAFMGVKFCCSTIALNAVNDNSIKISVWGVYIDGKLSEYWKHCPYCSAKIERLEKTI